MSTNPNLNGIAGEVSATSGSPPAPSVVKSILNENNMLGGSSPLTPLGTASVATSATDAASGLFSASMAPSNNTENERIFEIMIAHLQEEKKRFLSIYAIQHKSNRLAESGQALSKIKRVLADIEMIHSLSRNEFSSPEQRKGKQKLEGHTLPIRDLPKFRLASSQYPLNGNTEVFESDLHFITTFEDIIKSNSLDIEQAWRKLLPLCLDHLHTTWVDTELNKCTTWNEAKSAFHKKFGSDYTTMNHANDVWTMVMNDNESISEYTQRFAQKVFLARLDKKLHASTLAQRFLESLLYPIQVVVRIVTRRDEDEVERTFEEIAQIALNVLGDGQLKHASPVGSSSSSRRRRTHRAHKNGNSPIQKVYHCRYHSKNSTHNTADCLTGKRRQERQQNNFCRHCGEPGWTREHCCASTSNSDCNDNDVQTAATTSYDNHH